MGGGNPPIGHVNQRIHEVGCKPSPSPFLPSSHPYHCPSGKDVKWLANHFSSEEFATIC